MSEKERHLIEALLHLILYLGEGGEESDAVKKAKGLVFMSGSNPPTDYGRSKVGIGG